MTNKEYVGCKGCSGAYDLDADDDLRLPRFSEDWNMLAAGQPVLSREQSQGNFENRILVMTALN